MNKTAKKVMIFGTFDYFHAGHEDVLKQARKLGDSLTVVLARDKTVEKIKGGKPDHTEKQRLATLKKHELVDKAVLGNHKDKHKVILKHKPNVIALGYDQHVFTQTLQKLIIEHQLDLEIIRLEPYKPEIFKSSKIKARMMSDE